MKKNKTNFKTKLFIKKNKVLITFLLAIGFSYLTYELFNFAIKSSTTLVEVPVASKYLGSLDELTAEDITYIKVPKQSILTSVYTSADDIVGKYIKEYDSLAEGSFFYEQIITTDEKINSSELFQLNEGEVALPIGVDEINSYTNSIKKGQTLGIYFLGKVKETITHDTKLVYGEIVKEVRVISVQDEVGQEINGVNKNSVATIFVAVPQELAHYVELARAMGEISPVISYDNIQTGETDTTTYYDTAKLKTIIDGSSIDVELIPYEEEQVEG